MPGPVFALCKKTYSTRCPYRHVRPRHAWQWPATTGSESQVPHQSELHSQLEVARMTLEAPFELSPLWPLAMALAAVFVAATASRTVGFAFSAFAAGLLFQIM